MFCHPETFFATYDYYYYNNNKMSEIQQHVRELDSSWSSFLRDTDVEEQAAIQAATAKRLRLERNPHLIICDLLPDKDRSPHTPVYDAVQILSAQANSSNEARTAHYLLSTAWIRYQDRLYQAAKIEYFHPKEREHPMFTDMFFKRVTFANMFELPAWCTYCSIVPSDLLLLLSIRNHLCQPSAHSVEPNTSNRRRQQQQQQTQPRIGAEPDEIWLQKQKFVEAFRDFEAHTRQQLEALGRWAKEGRRISEHCAAVRKTLVALDACLDALTALLRDMEADPLTLAYDYTNTYDTVCQSVVGKIMNEWLQLTLDNVDDRSTQVRQLSKLATMVSKRQNERQELEANVLTLRTRFTTTLEFKSREARHHMLIAMYDRVTTALNDSVDALRPDNGGHEEMLDRLVSVGGKMTNDRRGSELSFTLYRQSFDELSRAINADYAQQLQQNRKTVDTFAAVCDVSDYTEHVTASVRVMFEANESDWHRRTVAFLRQELAKLQTCNYMPDSFRTTQRQVSAALENCTAQVKERLAKNDEVYRRLVTKNYRPWLARLRSDFQDLLQKLDRGDDLRPPQLPASTPSPDSTTTPPPAALAALKQTCRKAQRYAVNLLSNREMTPGREARIRTMLKQSKDFITGTANRPQDAWQAVHNITAVLHEADALNFAESDDAIVEEDETTAAAAEEENMF